MRIVPVLPRSFGVIQLFLAMLRCPHTEHHGWRQRTSRHVPVAPSARAPSGISPRLLTLGRSMRRNCCSHGQSPMAPCPPQGRRRGSCRPVAHGLVMPRNIRPRVGAWSVHRQRPRALDSARCIGYLTKYLTKQLGECHYVDTDAQRAHIERPADTLRFEPCSPTCANWLRYGIPPKKPRPGLVPAQCRARESWSCPSFSQAPRSLRAGGGSRLAKPSRATPQAALTRRPRAGQSGSRGRRPGAHRQPDGLALLIFAPCGVARLRRAGLPKAEPGAGAGPAAPQTPP
jgi:hypothetical protein